MIMKRTIVILAILFPFTVSSQIKNPSSPLPENEMVYYKEINSEIFENWKESANYYKGKNYEAIFEITIEKDGQIKISRILKTSGHSDFDYSGIIAIFKTGKVTPPPNGKPLEIGIRFSP